MTARRTRRRKIPFVQQLEAADCGAASLAMVLRFHGCDESLARVRDAVGTTPAGVSAEAIFRAAVGFGLRGRAVRVATDAIALLPAGSILHWEFKHFLVLERVSRRGVHVVDPSVGRRVLPLDRFKEGFTGVALLLEPGESFRAERRSGSAVWNYARGMLRYRPIAVRVLAASVFVQIFGVMLPMFTGILIDRVIPRGDGALLAVVAAAALGAVLFGGIATLARAYALVHLRGKADRFMTVSFVDHLMALPYGFFQRRTVGDLLMRVHSNAAVRDVLSTNGISALLDGVMVIVYALATIALSPAIALVVFVLGGLQVALLLASRRHFSERMSEELYAEAWAQSSLSQMLAGVQTLKTAGAEPYAIERWSNLFVAQLNAALHRGRSEAHLHTTLAIFDTAAPLVVLAVGGHQVLAGELSLGTMLAVSALATSFLRPLSELVRSGVQLTLVKSHLERIEDVMQCEREPESLDGSVVRLSGEITLSNVSFRYDADGPWVLKDVSLSIEPGRTVAIVGPSGSGKSTLAHLLVGLFPPSEGEIRFDGREIRGLPLKELRRSIGFVPQHPYLFDATVRENIALAHPDADLDRVVRAAKTACVHDDVSRMLNGYDTRLVDRGESLSGGQRQRIALARALLARPKVVVLDEATSALDALTETRVVDNLRTIDATRVVVAHRLSTIESADLIVVLRAGEIVEVGTHRELLARKGAYRELLSVQLGGQRAPAQRGEHAVR